jgi:hypothetical protein
MGFKEDWIKEDTLCGECGAVKTPATGLTRQNVKRLFSLKGTYMGWIMFFLMAVALFFAYTTYTVITAPVNCTNVSTLLSQEQQNVLNLYNQMPLIALENLSLGLDINTSYCQIDDPNSSTYCQDLNFTSILNETGTNVSNESASNKSSV